jgi:3-oxosteroid 1-dehydrogenase
MIDAHLAPVERATDQIWHDEADVVVVGGGGGGLTAALAASVAGRDVVVLEKAPQVGGTTAKAGGWYWVPNNRMMRARGMADPKPEALRFMARASHPESYDPEHPFLGMAEWEHRLIGAFYDHGADVTDALERLGVLKGTLESPLPSGPFPDYLAHLDENHAPFGRTHFIVDDEGRHVADGGLETIRRLQNANEERDVRIVVERRVTGVIVDDELAVVGVRVEDPDGRCTTVRARRAVVFASGGFTHNEAARRAFLPGPIIGGCAARTNEGDFLPIAQALGTELANMAWPWMAPLPLEEHLEGRPELMSTFLVAGDSSLIVNKYGNRVANEKAPYNELATAFLQWDPFRAEYPNRLLFLLWDSRVPERYSDMFFSYPLRPDGSPLDRFLIVVDDLASLGRAIQERLDACAQRIAPLALAPDFTAQLRETIARFNRLAQGGTDDDFHRGETPIELAGNWPREGGATNPTMHPLRENGPYYCMILAAGTLDTKGGPKVNERGQVLDALGSPIRGLYGVGNCVASPSGRGYWAGGATLGPIYTFGYLAGMSAAAEPAHPTAAASTGRQLDPAT